MTDAGFDSNARAELQQRLGYAFRNPALLDEALTHPSVVDGKSQRCDNERLEFLGDRVLGLVIADYLFGNLSHESEGLLTRRYAMAVENACLAAIARSIGIGPGLEVQPNTDLATQDKVLADALEAVVGAVWCDGGMDAVREVVLKCWGETLTTASSAAKDSKSLLQEYAAARGLPYPRYDVIEETGPAHDMEFTIRVSLAEHGEDAACKPHATGRGTTKRIAEQQAASLLLERLK